MVCIYEANPLEQAYSLYLANHVFGIMIPLPNNTNINISGRNAVSFLTQSGIDRGILRLIWSVADPQNLGSLVTIGQFHIVLRMVSMAQAGIFGNHMQSITDVTAAIPQYALQEMPLPVFSGVVMPQSNELMSMYGHLGAQNSLATNQSPMTMMGTPTPVGDAFGSLVEVQNAPLRGPNNDMVNNNGTINNNLQQDQQLHQIPTAILPNTFGDTSFTGDANDIPLPSFGGFDLAGSTAPGGATAAPSLTVSVSKDEDDDFGHFGSAAQPSTAQSNNINDNNGSSTAPAQRNELPGQGLQLQQQPFVTDFGRALSEPIASSGSNAMPISVPKLLSTVSVSDAFGDIGPIQDAPLPSLDAFGSNVGGGMVMDMDNQPKQEEYPAVTTEGDNNEDGGFGNYGTAAVMPAITDTLNESSDFVEFYQEEATVHPGTNDSAVEDDMNREQPFAISIDADRTVLYPMTAPTLQMIPVTDNGRSLSITDAFGDMPIQEDDPLPSLGGMIAMNTTPITFIEGQNNLDAIENEEDDDGFGAFEEAEAVTTLPESDLLQKDTIGPRSDGNKEDESDSDDDFGDFGGAAATDPTSSPILTDGQPPSSLGLDLLGFDTSAKTTMDAAAPVAILEPASTNTELAVPGMMDTGHVRSMSIDDAFGDFSVPENAALPPLEMIGANSNPSTQGEQKQGHNDANNQFDDEDDFGGFSGENPASAPHTEVFASVKDGDNDVDDEFGDFGAAASEKGAGLDQHIDLMGFGADGSLSELDGVRAKLNSSADTTSMFDAIQPLSISDAFGDMPTNDAPLPALDILIAPPNHIVESNELDTTNGENNNDFDRFKTPAAVPSIQIEPTSEPDLAATESGVSEYVVTRDSNLLQFDGVIESVPASIPPFLPAVTDPLSVSDAFGDFEVADAPLPSVDPTKSSLTESFSSATKDDNVDMLGNFTSHGESLISIDGREPVEKPVQGDGSDLLDMLGTESRVTTDHVTSHNDEDDFGDFGSANFAAHVEQKIEYVQPIEAGSQLPAPIEQNVQEDDFGKFGSAETITPIENDVPNAQLEGDDFGDFGGAKVTHPVKNDAHSIQPKEKHEFGDFGSSELAVHVEENTNTAHNEEEDDFGDFGSAELPSPVKDNSYTAQLAEEDDFGDFGSAKLTTPVKHNAHTAQPAQEDDFGDFGSAKLTTPVKHNAHTAETAEEDFFGDFGSPRVIVPVEQNVDDFGEFRSEITPPLVGNYDNAQSEEEDNFGKFGSAEVIAPIEQNVERSQSGGVQEFGDFGSADFIAPVKQNTNDVPPEEKDDFGHFGNAEFSPPVEPKTDIVQTESADEFGDFTVGEAPQTNNPRNDESFGDFASFQDSSPRIVQSQQTSESTAINKDDDSVEFGDFENISAPSTENDFTEEVRIRDRIRSLALQLPDCVLRKAGVSGDHVDLGESFEVNVGIKSSMTETSRRRTRRCIQVLESLTSTDNSKLASTFWVQIFDVVNEELEQAKILLIEAVSFSSDDWSEINAPLSVMVRGFAEYMRVTRSIVASIGDVLLLDESAILTVDTLASTWCSLSVLEKALDCEKKWKEIQNQLIKTPLGVVDTVSVEEIRSDANVQDAETRISIDTFCHLTLQPLRKKNKATTKEEVSFQGKCFMACSANFLANRCPFFVVGEEV